MIFRRALLRPLFLLTVAIIPARGQTPAPAAPTEIISPAPPTPPAVVDTVALRERVHQATLHAWEGYRQYAWGQDALRPLSKQGHNWYLVSLLMTPVDAFDTLRLMGLDEQANEAKELILSRLDFDVDDDVSAFEVTIRLLGGLLSAYEIDGDPRFLALARDLADRLAPSFDSPTGMPYRFVNLRTGKTRDPVSNPAEIGTLVLEYGTLSKHTGEPKYYARAKRAMVVLHGKRSALGLTGSRINVDTGEWVDSDSHVSGGIDSFLEYMVKGGILFRDPELATMWQESLPPLHRYLADDITTPGALWYGHADMHTGRRTAAHYGALDAFLPATLALGGDLEHARALQESNFSMWQLAGVEPEELDYARREITAPGYALRPENLESAYYLYHYTHDARYLRMGQVMFESLEAHCRTEAGFAALRDVRTKEKADVMESYFLAETLKYAFLLFDEGRALDFERVIFNTEAHPFRR